MPSPRAGSMPRALFSMSVRYTERGDAFAAKAMMCWRRKSARIQKGKTALPRTVSVGNILFCLAAAQGDS